MTDKSVRNFQILGITISLIASIYTIYTHRKTLKAIEENLLTEVGKKVAATI